MGRHWPCGSTKSPCFIFSSGGNGGDRWADIGHVVLQKVHVSYLVVAEMVAMGGQTLAMWFYKKSMFHI